MRYFTTIFFLLCTFIVHGQHHAKLSPRTKIFLLQIEQKPNSLPPNYIYKQIGSETYLSAFIKVNATIDEATMRTLGVKTGTKAGNIWTIQIPVAKLRSVSLINGIEYLQLDEPIHPTLDAARILTKVDSVHAGLGSLPSPYHGDNVVVGVIDAGFDYRHPSLFDTTGARYRVKRIWEQTNAGTPPTGLTYGNEIKDTMTMWNEGNDMPTSHGAHVTGIAAGSGYGSTGNKKFRGMADASDLVLVSITPPSSDWTSTGMTSIIDALNYIYSYAASVGKPAIANLSWGCSIGSHDGLSLFSQACDNLTGAGKIFALSAGNNGTNNIHIQKTFTAADTLVRTFATFNAALGANKTWVDIWGDSSQNFCVQLSLYNGTQAIDSTGYFCLDNLVHPVYARDANGDTLYAVVSTSSAEFNGKPRVFLDIYSKASGNVMVSVKGTNGTVNMWSGYVQNTTGYYANFVSNGVPGAVNGNSNMTIGDMACTKSAITVGAYISRPSFTNIDGSTVTLALTSQNGNIASFSSKGPTADGRIKPDITAPGMAIGSAVNSYDSDFITAGSAYSYVVEKFTDPKNSREYAHAMLMGTSMSSPAVSGIIALMLQTNPSLTPQQVQLALAQTAILDLKTGVIPPQGSNTWGYGKINAMAAVKRAMTISDIRSFPLQKSTLNIYPNPAQDVVYLNFNVTKSMNVTVTVFDLTGRQIFSHNTSAQDGDNTFQLNAKDWNRGIYVIRLQTDNSIYTERCVLQ
ncbi:MAG TPA: S8/S53 family peptidase [Flavipsychrobacter sp.]|nr:S8/S53 family peptidase [Flavipsychrobacter sp.]